MERECIFCCENETTDNKLIKLDVVESDSVYAHEIDCANEWLKRHQRTVITKKDIPDEAITRTNILSCECNCKEYCKYFSRFSVVMLFIAFASGCIASPAIFNQKLILKAYDPIMIFCFLIENAFCMMFDKSPKKYYFFTIILTLLVAGVVPPILHIFSIDYISIALLCNIFTSIWIDYNNLIYMIISSILTFFNIVFNLVFTLCIDEYISKSFKNDVFDNNGNIFSYPIFTIVISAIFITIIIVNIFVSLTTDVRHNFNLIRFTAFDFSVMFPTQFYMILIQIFFTICIKSFDNFNSFFWIISTFALISVYNISPQSQYVEFLTESTYNFVVFINTHIISYLLLFPIVQYGSSTNFVYLFLFIFIFNIILNIFFIAPPNNVLQSTNYSFGIILFCINALFDFYLSNVFDMNTIIISYACTVIVTNLLSFLISYFIFCDAEKKTEIYNNVFYFLCGMCMLKKVKVEVDITAVV